MQVSRHRIYERTCKDEENGFLREAMALVQGMTKPRGWTRRKDRGRPPEHGPGRPIEYPWRSLVVSLLLMQYLGLGYRDMAAHVQARPGLLEMLGFGKAPSKTTLHRAHQALTQGWLEGLNARVLEGFQGGDPGGPLNGTWPWTPPASRRVGEAATTFGG